MSAANLAPKGWSTGKYVIGRTDVVGLNYNLLLNQTIKKIFGEVADKFVGNEFGHLSVSESGTKYRGTGCAESMAEGARLESVYTLIRIEGSTILTGSKLGRRSLPAGRATWIMV